MPALFVLTHHSTSREGGKRGCDQVKNLYHKENGRVPVPPVLPHGATSNAEWSSQEESQTLTERDSPNHHHLLWNPTETCLVALWHCLSWKNKNVTAIIITHGIQASYHRKSLDDPYLVTPAVTILQILSPCTSLSHSVKSHNICTVAEWCLNSSNSWQRYIMGVLDPDRLSWFPFV